jgi:hypothetical protein
MSGGPPVRQMEDRSFNPRVVGVGLVALAIFAAGSFWAWAHMEAWERRLLAPAEKEAIPTEVRAPEVGIVMKTLFDEDTRFVDAHAAQAVRLENWGWVDRDKGLIHMPIEKAMELVAGGETAH